MEIWGKLSYPHSRGNRKKKLDPPNWTLWPQVPLPQSTMPGSSSLNSAFTVPFSCLKLSIQSKTSVTSKMTIRTLGKIFIKINWDDRYIKKLTQGLAQRRCPRTSVFFWRVLCFQRKALSLTLQSHHDLPPTFATSPRIALLGDPSTAAKLFSPPSPRQASHAAASTLDPAGRFLDSPNFLVPQWTPGLHQGPAWEPPLHVICPCVGS